jgi:hypothetical protein
VRRREGVGSPRRTPQLDGERRGEKRERRPQLRFCRIGRLSAPPGGTALFARGRRALHTGFTLPPRRVSPPSSRGAPAPVPALRAKAANKGCRGPAGANNTPRNWVPKKRRRKRKTPFLAKREKMLIAAPFARRASMAKCFLRCDGETSNAGMAPAQAGGEVTASSSARHSSVT